MRFVPVLPIWNERGALSCKNSKLWTGFVVGLLFSDLSKCHDENKMSHDEFLPNRSFFTMKSEVSICAK